MALTILYTKRPRPPATRAATTVKVADDARKVSMLRFGKRREEGTRHLCHYETGYGAISLGVSADVIEHALDENGGKLQFSYTRWIPVPSFISRNLVDITVDKLPES